MDPHTLDILEFERVRAMLAEYAQSALGRGMAARIRPTARADLVARWLAQVDEMIQAGARLGYPPFAGVHDIANAVRSAVPPHCLEPADFAVLAETFEATGHIRRWAAQLTEHQPRLREITEGIGDFRPLAEAIRKVVDERGEIRDEASARLKRIRIDIANARIRIGQVIDRLLRDRNATRWLQYPQATFHEDRLVLPLAAEHRGRVPGIIHRSSDSGATLFVEPAEAVALNNQIISLKADETTEINRLLWHLTHKVQLNCQSILQTLERLAVLDLITAKARWARAAGLVCPRIAADGRLRLIDARHLLLVDLARKTGQGPVVPMSVRLGEDFDVLVITGPNTGGKTVALKTVGLCCLMAQAGLPIPAADGSAVPVYRDVLVDIGDEQSLQQSLSTFSAHMRRIMHMLRHAGPQTLLLIDELGAGTDPDEGAAIGQAIVEELLARRCPALVSTHLGALKSLAYTHPRAENACVEFDEQTLRPTYRLIIGEPGNSHAINIAARLGLPGPVVEAARRHLSQSHEQLARAIRGTLTSRRMAEIARAEADAARVAAEQERRAAEDLRRELQQKQADFDRWVQTVTRLKPGDTVHVQRFDRPGKVVRVMLHKQLAVVNVGAMDVEIPLGELRLPDSP